MTPAENLLEPQFSISLRKLDVSPPVLVYKVWQLLKRITPHLHAAMKVRHVMGTLWIPV